MTDLEKRLYMQLERMQNIYLDRVRDGELDPEYVYQVETDTQELLDEMDALHAAELLRG